MAHNYTNEEIRSATSQILGGGTFPGQRSDRSVLLPKDLEYTEEEVKALDYADRYTLRSRISQAIREVSMKDPARDHTYRMAVSDISKAKFALETLRGLPDLDSRVTDFYEAEVDKNVDALNKVTKSYAVWEKKRDKLLAVQKDYDTWDREQRKAEDAKRAAERDSDGE